MLLCFVRTRCVWSLSNFTSFSVMSLEEIMKISPGRKKKINKSCSTRKLTREVELPFMAALKRNLSAAGRSPAYCNAVAWQHLLHSSLTISLFDIPRMIPVVFGLWHLYCPWCQCRHPNLCRTFLTCYLWPSLIVRRQFLGMRQVLCLCLTVHLPVIKCGGEEAKLWIKRARCLNDD